MVANKRTLGACIALIFLMFLGVAGSLWSGQELDKTTRDDWLKQFRIDAARLTDGILFWTSKTKVNLRAISSQIKAQGVSDQDGFLTLIDEASSWDPDVVFDSVAFAHRVMRPQRATFEARHNAEINAIPTLDEQTEASFEAFVVSMSSVGDGHLKRMNDLSTHPALKSAVFTAYRLPGDVILGPTYVDDTGHRRVLIATASENLSGKGVMVAEIDVSEFFSVFLADHMPKGMELRLIERDSEARAESIFIPVFGELNPAEDVVDTEVLRLISGQARWDLNWDVTPGYLNGPSNIAVPMMQIGGSVLSILIFGAIGYLTLQNIRFNAQVAEQTAALSQNSMIVQLTMDSIDQGFAVWNSDQRLVVWSRRCYDFWLEPPGSVLRTGMHMRDLLTHLLSAGAFGENADPAIVDTEMQRISSAGQASEDRFALPNGRQVHVRRFPLEHGGYVAVYTDITDQEEVTKRLNNANKELEKKRQASDSASQAKTDFLATMSHEIRTPMTGVLGFADMLLSEDLPETSKTKVQKIKESTRSLLQIINDILDISKIEAKKLEIETRAVNLPTLVQDVVSFFDTHDERAAKIFLSIADDCPDNIAGDPARIRQVLINLIGNAVKFTHQGEITVTVEWDAAPGFLRFAVKDTGIGIADEMIPKMFIDFTQADTSISREYEGTGLGLSISKRLVELMGGEIGVSSKLGIGSEFWFTLPYFEAPQLIDISDRPPSSVSPTAGTRKLRILVAEDNELNRAIISHFLDLLGHDWRVANDGQAAVTAHKTETFDLILMDVRMPIMSGTEATKEIRCLAGDKGAVPIVALTADAMTEHQKEYIDVGMNAVVAKPIDLNELVTAINTAMGEPIHTFESKLPS